GMACEVKIVHREEIPGHQNATERRGIIAFLHRAGGGFPPGGRRVFSNGGTRLQPFERGPGAGRKDRGKPTPQDLLLPEGKLIRTTRGGANALKQLLLDLKT